MAAGVLLYRALSHVLPVPLGLLTYLYWRRTTRRHPVPGAAQPPDLLAQPA